MPTLAELIIQITFDRTKLTDGRKAVDETLSNVDRRVGRSGHAADQLADRWLSALRAIHEPGRALSGYLERAVRGAPAAKRGLNDVAGQARRTGSAVAEGILAGSGALRVFAGAALGVGAAVFAVDRAVKAVAASAETMFGRGVGAAASGLPVREFSAIQRAANIGANVPESDTAAALVAWGQAASQWRHGAPPTDEIAGLARFGITGFGASTTGEQFLRTFAAGAGKLSISDTIAAGMVAHLAPALALWLRRVGPAGLDQAVAAQRGGAETTAQLAAAQKYLKALNDLKQQYDTLQRTLVTELEPALGRILGDLAAIAKDVPPFIAFLDRIAKFLNWAAGVPTTSSGAGKDNTWLGQPIWDGIHWLRRHFGMSSQSSLGSGASSANVDTAMSFFEGKGLTKAQAAGVVGRLSAESGLNPIALNPQSGAYGIAQWLGNRKGAALATGGDLNAQLALVWHELNTTETPALAKIRAATDVHDAAVAMESYERAGDPAFTQHAADIAERVFAGAALGVGGAVFAVDRVAAFGRLIDHLAFSAGGGGVTNHNDNRHVEGGDINVTVNGGADARGTARIVTDAITRANLHLTSAANTGLQ